MEKKVIEEIKRINSLMIIEKETFSKNNISEQKTILMEGGGRGEIFERFFKVVFSDSGDNLLRNADEGFSVLQKQADELVAAQKMTKQQADDAMSMVKKYIDDLKVASGDIGKVVDDLPKKGVPEAVHIKVSLKKFLNLLDDAAITKMRRQIFKNLRNSPDYIKWSTYYQNELFTSLIAEYEQRLAKGGGFKISRETLKKDFSKLMKSLDQKGGRTIWNNTPEFYDDVAEHSQKAVDDFFNGTTYNGMGLKILKKSVGEVIDGYKTLDDVAPLTDEETKYLNEQYRIKNGVAGNIRLSISELYSKMKGYNKEIGEVVDDTFRQMAEVENLFKAGDKMYTAQVLLVKIQENLKKINKLDSAAKLSFTDWVNKNISNENLKKIFTESSPGDAISKVGVQNGTSADDVVNNVGDNVNNTPVENIDTWKTWWKEARDDYKNARNELTFNFTKKVGDLFMAGIPFGKSIQKYGKELQTIKAATDEAEKKGLLRLFAEWSASGTMGLTREYGEFQKYLPGLEPIINLLGVISPRVAGAKTRRQVYKRLVQLGAQYTYSFLFWTIVTALKKAILGALLLSLRDPDTQIGKLGLYSFLKDWFPTEKIIEEYRNDSSSICFYSSDCGEFKTQSTPVGLINAFTSNFIQEFTKYGEEVYKVAAGGPTWSTLGKVLPGWIDNVLIVFFQSKDRSEAEIKLSEQQKELEESANEVIEVIKTNDDGTKERVKVLTDPTEGLKSNSREWWLRLIVAKGWNAEKIIGPMQDTHKEIEKNTGLKVWAADYVGQNVFIFNKRANDNLYYFFKLSNDLNTPQYKTLLKSEKDNPDIWEKIKKEDTWVNIEKTVKDLNDVQENIEQRIPTTPNININDSIYNKRNKLIMERKTRRIFEEKDEKFGEEKFEHWKKTFEFSSQDPETKEWKRIEKETIESKQVDIEKWVDHYLKSNDEDDAFVRSVIHVFKLDKNPKNHVKKVSFNKGLAHLSENFEVGGLLRVVSLIRESKELEIWSVKYYADGNWELVKGSFNDEELKNVGKTVRERDKKEEERKKPVEGLKKKELTGIQLLNQDEKQGLTELPKQVQRKLLEKLRNGWVTEKPYEFFNEFYSVSNINTIFNEKLKIYKLNPSKEFFNSLVKNSPRIFPRKGICKALSGVENDENINERTKIVLNHILQKCQTKFKGEYGVKQIKTN